MKRANKGRRSEVKRRKLDNEENFFDSRNLTEEEKEMSNELLDPQSLLRTWEDVFVDAGIVSELNQNLVIPMKKLLSGKSPSRMSCPPKGILIYGPHGCGKTLLCEVIAKESGVRCLKINLGSFLSGNGAIDGKIEALFSFAEKISPCIIFIEELEYFGLQSESILSTFLESWDSTTKAGVAHSGIVVIGITTLATDVDPGMLRRMAMKIKIPLPDEGLRKAVFGQTLESEKKMSKVELEGFAKLTENFTVDEILEVCRRACVMTLDNSDKANKRQRQLASDDVVKAIEDVRQTKEVGQINFASLSKLFLGCDPSEEQNEEVDEEASDGLQLDKNERFIARGLLSPSDFDTENIAIDSKLMDQIEENIIFPLKYRELLKDSKLCSAPRGILLYGPPGCGKTLLSKVIAQRAEAKFINVDIADIFNKWLGDSEKRAKAVFSLAEKIAPCIIFIDEIDSLLQSRSASDNDAVTKVKAQFLRHWDGMETKPQNLSPIVLIGATNRKEVLDPAVLRRMPMQFNIGLPSKEMRSNIFQKTLKNEATEDDMDWAKLAEMTENFSGSDIAEVCRKASMLRVRDMIHSTDEEKVLRPLAMLDIEQAISEIRNSKQDDAHRSMYN